MNASSLLGGGRGSLLTRFAVVFLLLLAIFLTHDLWLPRAQNAYQGVKSGHVFNPNRPDGADVDSEHLTTTPEHSSSAIPSHTSAHTSAHTSSTSQSSLPSPTNHLMDSYPPVPDAVADTAGDECMHLPGAEKVNVILKTGATELYQKVPTHFMTTFRCVPKLSIYSDVKQEFGGVQIHDAIKGVSQEWQQKHDDFKLYRQIQEWYHEGQDLSQMQHDEGGDAWNLDKWKFMPMFVQAFQEADPEIEWFFMMEADTSISWLNLLLWVKQLDSRKPYFLGAPTMLGDTVFAHGGSGILISRKAADMLLAARDKIGHEKYDLSWEEMTSVTCCGDAIIAQALLAIDIPLTGANPLIQGRRIWEIGFTHDNWCQPPVTFHHAIPIEVDEHWHFEKNWTDTHGWTQPYVFRDLFAHLIEPWVADRKTAWNNWSTDHRYVSANLAGTDEQKEFNDQKPFQDLQPYEQQSVDSEDACAAACRHKEGDCIQWMFQPGRCYLGRDLRLGVTDERESEHWTSGWLLDRIESFKNSFDKCVPDWPH